jgi:hypothetical protein
VCYVPFSFIEQSPISAHLSIELEKFSKRFSGSYHKRLLKLECIIYQGTTGWIAIKKETVIFDNHLQIWNE